MCQSFKLNAWGFAISKLKLKKIRATNIFKMYHKFEGQHIAVFIRGKKEEKN